MTPNPLKVTAELPGSALKWIHAAEHEFAKQHINVDHYTVTVLDQEKSVVVVLAGLSAIAPPSPTPQAPPFPPAPLGPPPGRGSSGALPGFEVELSKIDLRVVRANYVR